MNEEPADIAILTSYPRAWFDMAEVTNQLKDEYARQHGYHHWIDQSDIYAVAGKWTGMSIRGFIKFDLILHYLPRYKWVVWIDADALITNREKRLESFIERFPDKDIIVSEDHNGFHTTVIFVRNTPLARDCIWAANNTGRDLYMDHGWHEMEALRRFSMDHRYRDTFGYLSAKETCPILKKLYVPHLPLDIGAEFGWEPGDWILHVSAQDLHTRLFVMKHFADPAHVCQECEHLHKDNYYMPKGT